MARPRPVRALGRPRLDADLCAAASPRLRGDDDRSDQALPPARLDHRGASGARAHARHRDHHRSARPGARQRRRHGDRGSAPGGELRQGGRRPPHLCARLRRRPDGRHQPGGDRARRPSQAEQADRAVRRQRHFHRRSVVARRLGRPGEAVRGGGLEREPHRRPRSRRDRRRARGRAEIRPPGDDRLPHHHRLRRAHQGRQGLIPWLAARRRRDRRRAQGARLVGGAVRGSGRRARALAQRRQARAAGARSLVAARAGDGRRQARRFRAPRRRQAARRARRRRAVGEEAARRRAPGDREPYRLGTRA